MEIKPTKSFVLVAAMKQENVTPGGIVIESSSGTGDSKRAKVLAIGPDVLDVQVGDVVMLDWTKGQLVTVEGAQRVMVKEEHIVAVLEE